MEAFAKLGIDWRLLIAQIINFGILLFILHRFAYKPMLSMLEKRESMIEKSVNDAKAIDEKLKTCEERVQEIGATARKDAASILEVAEKNAEQRRVQALEKTKEEVRGIVEQTRAMLAQEKTQMLGEVRQEVARLVVLATERVLSDVATQKISDDLVKKTIHEVIAAKQ